LPKEVPKPDIEPMFEVAVVDVVVVGVAEGGRKLETFT
jgi:hypothetical protein